MTNKRDNSARAEGFFRKVFRGTYGFSEGVGKFLIASGVPFAIESGRSIYSGLGDHLKSHQQFDKWQENIAAGTESLENRLAELKALGVSLKSEENMKVNFHGQYIELTAQYLSPEEKRILVKGFIIDTQSKSVISYTN